MTCQSYLEDFYEGFLSARITIECICTSSLTNITEHCHVTEDVLYIYKHCHYLADVYAKLIIIDAQCFVQVLTLCGEIIIIIVITLTNKEGPDQPCVEAQAVQDLNCLSAKVMKICIVLVQCSCYILNMTLFSLEVARHKAMSDKQKM